MTGMSACPGSGATAHRPRRLRRGRTHPRRGSARARRRADRRLRHQARHRAGGPAHRARGAARRAARGLARGAGGGRGSRAQRRHGEPDRRRRRSLGAGHPAGHLVPRLQFGLARREGPGSRPDRRRGRPLRRGRGDDLRAALSHSRAAAARRAARGRAQAAARRAGLRRQGRIPASSAWPPPPRCAAA